MQRALRNYELKGELTEGRVGAKLVRLGGDGVASESEAGFSIVQLGHGL